MTAVVDRPTEAEEAPTAAPAGAGAPPPDVPFRDDPNADGAAPAAVVDDEEDLGPVEVPIRPLLVAAATTSGAAFMTGGVFGSWLARLVCLLAGLGGVGWAYLALRSPRRRGLMANGFPAVLVVVGLASLIVGAEGGPGNAPELIRFAAKNAKLLKPPVPFDAGWRPIVILVMGLVGFAAAWMGGTKDRTQTAFVVPIPVLAFTGLTQPKEGQLISGLLGLLPLIIGLGVVFGGGSAGGAKLDRAFEAKRAIRSLAALVPAIAALILLSTTNFLFPAPVYDPSSKPQKPKAQSANAQEDKVLFEVTSEIPGPWKLGVLDVYDGRSWKLPPFSGKQQQKVKGSATFDSPREGDVEAKITVRDLGVNSSVPFVVGATSYEGPSGLDLNFDRRSQVLRVPQGRVPLGVEYTVRLPRYPSQSELRQVGPLTSNIDKDLLEIPPPPRAVEDLLATAPDNPFDRLQTLLKPLTSTFTAVGEGAPADITPERIQELIAGNHEGSPYEFVAAQAMLARWAGVPSRIGFGFDNIKAKTPEGRLEIHPRDAAQWLEVYYEGIGWVPVAVTPPKAKANLDNEDQKFDPKIVAGSDVAVEVYIPVRKDTFKQLYEKVRAVLVTLSPILALLLAAYLFTPAAKRAYRRAKRRRWAERAGPTEQIAVEYAEFRDLTTDLGVGDPYATPLEFLDHLVVDDEHTELAWLVSRCLYGDLAGQAGPQEVEAARDLVESLSRRLRRGQPLQSRVIAVLSRSSLLEPYTDEVPGIRTLPRLELRRRLAARTARRPRPVKAVLATIRARRIERRRRQVRALAGRS